MWIAYYSNRKKNTYGFMVLFYLKHAYKESI